MDKFYNDISLFRFSLIAPIINNTHNFNSINEYISFIAAQKHYFNNKEYTFSKSCIKNWYLSYKKKGITALQSKTRSDKNSSRLLTYETINRIQELREQFPHITGTSIYNKLIEEDYIHKNDISLSTVLRYLKSNNLKANQVCNVERRMFEMENINDCWQADTSVGPYIIIDGTKYKTYIIMFIDDKSRLIMGYDIFLNDTAINMQKVFKNAIKTYGKPKRLFVDNGGPYDNKQLSLICASLGIELIHAKPYSPEAKAKQERLFRTIKDGWMRSTDWNTFNTLDDIRISLNEFINKNYINKIHSSIKMTPNDRWHQEYEKVIFLDENFIEESFLHRTFNKVRKDRTISFKNEYYEVPFKYIGQTIELRYNPNDLSKLYLYENNSNILDIYKVDKISNSKCKRKNTIDYSKVLNDERDVIEMEEK